MSADEVGQVEGETCNRNGCTGTIALRPIENCSCHISPPCSACTAPNEYCPECDWQAIDDEEHLNGFLVRYKPNSDVIDSYRRRPLDPTKIDYHTKSHTHFSMICEGVYPDGTTMAQVLERVQGTFGGRFEHFGKGKFKYIAYTD